MSELVQYYEAFSTRLLHGEGLDAEDCRCHGGGWILSDVDTWHKCPDHHVAGQPHPEDDQDAWEVYLEDLDFEPVVLPEPEPGAVGILREPRRRPGQEPEGWPVIEEDACPF
jgi:hypothetical protein